jgi:predicted alpha/beta hydrolase family esterase
MRSTDVDILVVPGWGNSGPEHWQTRWQDKLSTARRVGQPDWENPDRSAWVGNVIAAANAATRPVVLLAHSIGVATVVHAAGRLSPHRVIGAFLVAPPSEAFAAGEPALASFAPYPTECLPFASVLVASRNDLACTFDAATTLAVAWGSRLVDAGEVAHINEASGHGPWPEGIMRFAGFLKELSAPAKLS